VLQHVTVFKVCCNAPFNRHQLHSFVLQCLECLQCASQYHHLPIICVAVCCSAVCTLNCHTLQHTATHIICSRCI